jgi:hypothetical protein
MERVRYFKSVMGKLGEIGLHARTVHCPASSVQPCLSSRLPAVMGIAETMRDLALVLWITQVRAV